MCLTRAIISSPGKVWVGSLGGETTGIETVLVYVILNEGLSKMCSITLVNILHLHKHFGQPETLHCTGSWPETQHFKLIYIYMGLASWRKLFTCYGCQLKSFSTGAVFSQLQERFACFCKMDSTGKNKHQSSISLFADDIQSILFDCLLCTWQNIN